jgi:curli production assembly/transport component CsgE
LSRKKLNTHLHRCRRSALGSLGFILAGWALCASSPAAEAIGPSLSQGAPLDRPIHADPYDGVVVDQTITLPGHSFYQAFVAAWRDKALSERYSVTVGERPSRLLGSQVWVEFSHRRLFQASLPPARWRIDRLGDEAAEVAYQNISRTEVERLLFRDPDLGRDEL